MGPIKHPEPDPEHDNKPVQASPANYTQNNPGSVYIVKKNTVNWDLLLQESRFFGECACAKGKPVNLDQDSKKKITKVAETEENLVNYSKKAEEEARKREEELRKQPVIQMEEARKN